MWLSSSEGNSPLEAQSAGFSRPSTWFHWSGDMTSTMYDTLLPTKVLNFMELPISQLRTIVLSVQAYTLLRGILSASLTWESNCASSWAPHNLSCGIVSLFDRSNFRLGSNKRVLYLAENISHA